MACSDSSQPNVTASKGANTEMKIAIIGECMVEISGQLLGTMQQSYGGDTFNTACYLKYLAGNHLNVSYVTVMGQDALSNAIVDSWQQKGIDCQFVLRTPNKHPGLYSIQNDHSGERYFQYWRNDAAARYLMQQPETPSVFESLGRYQAVYLSGISLAILPESDRIQIIEALRKLKGLGVKIVFDSNYRPGLWRTLADTLACYEQMYTISDLALLTFEDERLIWQDTSPDTAIGRLAKYSIPELVLKDGANGCYYHSQNHTIHFATTPVKDVVDTTAAGDSFNAGYLDAWLSSASPEICANRGNKLATQVIKQKGAIVPIDLPLIK